ncbi:MAG: phosphoadenylyl-sulfate reductase [Bacteroidota bacterium]
MDLTTNERLNSTLSTLLTDARLAHILNTYTHQVLITSSFGTTSALLLHTLLRIKPDVPIYFLNTGYLFKETLEYMRHLKELWNLNVIEIHPEKREHILTLNEERWKTDPDACCMVNKSMPLNVLKQSHRIWISGLMGYQSEFREQLSIFEPRADIDRFYPFIDWTPELVQEYFETFQIPRHPLEGQGFSSIGCVHCTAKGPARTGRWIDSQKTECGLHT